MDITSCLPTSLKALSLVSYNITKDGVKVAELTFVKSAYRVGETVTGLVEFNDVAQTKARVLKVRFLLWEARSLSELKS